MTATATKPPADGTQAVASSSPSLLKELYWEPFPAFAGMRRMMDSIFDSMMPVMETGPALDVYEKDGVYGVECAVPGYKKEDITVDARDHEITITGAFADEKTDENTRFHKRQLRRGSFSRTITLPQEIDPEKVTAKLENGVLKVRATPLAPAETKKVPVEVT